jgi:hypothetical protein
MRHGSRRMRLGRVPARDARRERGGLNAAVRSGRFDIVVEEVGHESARTLSIL